MITPLVTIGIPFYNCEKYLLDAVRSIFSQTYSNWELVLLDDGSTDKSLEIARSINDKRVRVISDGQNKKLAARLNQIVELAQGQFIGRMDADDLCSPNRIEKQMELFRKDSNLDLVGTGIIYLDHDDTPIGHRVEVQSHSEICGRPAQNIRLCHPSIIAKKAWYKKYRYDETLPLSQDYDLWLRSYQESKFANVTSPLYYYRISSSFSLRKQCKGRYIVSTFLFKHYKKQNRPLKALWCPLLQGAKLTAEIGLCSIGLKEKLIARRYEKLTDADTKVYESEIKKIKSVSLPLLTSFV